jgi:uncharacterized protein (TIGR02145 family)
VNEYSYSFDVINIEPWAQSGSFEDCGVCWSPDPQPTFDDMKSVAQKNGMKLVKTKKGRVRGETKKVRVRGEISGLKACSTYYARAFVVYNEGIVYGEEKSFTTFCCGTSTVKDYDDNTYNTVKIGKQCWMKQNLRTTHYADGTLIRQGVDTSSTIAYWYYPDNNSANEGTYGLLYNWKAVMRNASSSSSNPSKVQGVCPRGWHVPSDGEWTQLTGYVGSNSSYCCSSNSGYVAKSLASKTGWKESNNACSVGNMSDSNNLTGFSAFPAGYYIDEYDCFGYCTYFWSATERVSDTSCAYFRRLKYNESNVDNLYRKKYFGFSVRCVRD